MTTIGQLEALVTQRLQMVFEEIRSEIEAMGFQLDRILDFLPMQHGLIFSKKP